MTDIKPRYVGGEPTCTGSTRYYHGDDCPFVEEDIGDHGETERLWCRVDGKSCTRGGICGPALIRQRDEARREVCAILSIEAGSDRQTMLDLASERGWSYLYCAPAPVIP